MPSEETRVIPETTYNGGLIWLKRDNQGTAFVCHLPCIFVDSLMLLETTTLRNDWRFIGGGAHCGGNFVWFL